MRHLNHLPIWRDANPPLLAVEQAVWCFPWYYKYTLETESRTAVRDGAWRPVILCTGT